LAVAEHFGGIDVWINSAGLYPSGELLNCTREKWDALASINIAGALHGAQVATPHLKRRGGGVIVNISSYAAIIPTAGRGAYGMTKAALSSMTRTLAAELAPLNIRVVAVLPGMIFTPLTRDVAVEEKIPELSRRTALNRLGVPEDVAPAVVFLSSDAASYITGCGLEISGGKYCVQNPDAAWERA
jgi:NAD(P)-dependent dehydrogenase (short-subunit alcohol dehydrogenase family)